MLVALRDRVSVERVAGGWLLLDETAGAYWWLDQRNGEALWTVLGAGNPESTEHVLPNWPYGCYDMTRDDLRELLTWLYASSLIECLDGAPSPEPKPEFASHGT